MNCVNCNTEIPPTYVAAIRNNACPACGSAFSSQEEHTALFALVNTILKAEVGLDEDSIIRLSAALYGKFDIFPKGVVQDGYVTKEVIYIRDTPHLTQPIAQNQPATFHQVPRGKPVLATRRAQTAQERIAQMQEQVARESSETIIDDGDEEVSIQELEAERMARQRMARLQAEKAGVKP